MFTDKDLRNLIVPLFIEQFLLMFVGIADTFVVSVSSEADVSGGLRVLSVDHHAVPAVPRRLRCGGGAVPQYRENRRDHERFHCRQRHQCGRQLCGRIHPAFYFKKLNKITLVLINNIFNGLAYPFAGSLGNGLRAAGDVKFTMVVSISLTIGARLLDMLHGSIWDKIPRFALPVAATALLVFGALVICRPARRFAAERAEGTL